MLVISSKRDSNISIIPRVRSIRRPGRYKMYRLLNVY